MVSHSVWQGLSGGGHAEGALHQADYMRDVVLQRWRRLLDDPKEMNAVLQEAGGMSAPLPRPAQPHEPSPVSTGNVRQSPMPP